MLAPERYLTSFVRTPRLLRKPVRPGDLQLVRDQIMRDADGVGFEAHEGPVAVSISLFPPVDGRQQPEMPKVVKAYLDAMQGIAYDNDRHVEYLQVRQSATRHPLMDGYVPRLDDESDASVFLEVEPLEDYTSRYDRAVRYSFFRRRAPWWPEWSARDEAELIRNRRLLKYFGGNGENPL